MSAAPGRVDVEIDPSQARPSGPRFHEMDALRAFAMLLGIVLHTALFFMPDAWSKAYSAEGYPAEVSGIYTLMFFAIHGFRMPVFFLLSGFFTALLWQKRGLRQLAEQRLKRIGLPLAIGAFTVIPVTTTVFIWAFDALEEVEYSIFWWPFIWLSTLSHLWFLWLLLWLCGGFIVAARLGVRFSHPVIWWLAIPLTLLPQLLMHEPVFGPDTSDKLIPNPVVLGYYALFFVFGAFLYQRGIQISRWWTLALLPALTVVFFGGLNLLFEAKERSRWAKPLAALLQASYWPLPADVLGADGAISPDGLAESAWAAACRTPPRAVPLLVKETSTCDASSPDWSRCFQGGVRLAVRPGDDLALGGCRRT